MVFSAKVDGPPNAEDNMSDVPISAIPPSPAKTNKQDTVTSFSTKWTRTLKAITKPVIRPFIKLSVHAARHPKTCVASIITFSIGIMVIGLATNYNEDTSDEIWSPQNSRPVDHGKWIEDESNFPKDTRVSLLIVHRDGKNILGDDEDFSLAHEGTKRMFEALDEFRSTPGYDDLCNLSSYIHPATNEVTCNIMGISGFWNDSTAIFEEDIDSDDAVRNSMSAEYFPFGSSVDRDQIIGFNQFREENGEDYLVFGKSYVTIIELPENEEEAKPFEKKALDRILDLQDTWSAEDGNDFRVEIIADRSFEDEFGRAVSKDFPLLPVVFILMSLLCVTIFSKRDRVLSRSTLGFGAVVTVLLAIIASFGLLFTIGVPFTSLTTLTPFIMFGVGLDDAFIIYGSYSRTNHKKDPVDRIQETMEDIGETILLTTLTSSTAFALGCISSIPAVKYLVMYGFPTIIIDFLYQITFFVALIVLDERRIQANHCDCLCCCKAFKEEHEEETYESGEPSRHFADKVMASYSDWLLRPHIKKIVLVFFTAMLGFFAWRTTMLDQYFDFTEVIPSDSYIQTWWDAYNDYYEANGVRAGVYFRDVDFSNPTIRDEMEIYVSALEDIEYTAKEVSDFWLDDFNAFIKIDASMEALSFEKQIEAFLNDPVNSDTHGDDIVLDENGVMTASRTLLRFDNVDEQDVLEAVDALEAQRDVTSSQPINQDKKDWSFFTFSEDYYIWEFYRVCPYELTLSTILGTVTVSILALLLIPHWSAILFIGPMVAVLYIDLLGFIQLCGLHVSPVMYIGMVMSIGLMVDFVMHVTLRYLETSGTSRTAKTKETLETIGASLLVGGLSTILGVIPLVFSSSEIFFTVFIIFFGLILLGLLHGLVLLPVLLSMIGPLTSIGKYEAQEAAKEEADEDSV